jgi:23S rRNA (cytosine1962-C5)-methyltransferase
LSQQLVLKKDQDRRLRAGHMWIYSNEVDTGRSPLKDLPPGETVSVLGNRGNWIGWGYVNPHTLICARLVSRDHPLGYPLIEERLAAALALRERIYPEPFYRLAFGEADGLPGLVVDRYGDVLVVQISTAGMERHRDAIVEALTRLLSPRAVVLRNDGSARALEGLPSYVEAVVGDLPEQVEVREGGASFGVSVTEGQKTGWFFDQAANRDRLTRYAPGKRVLDVFSYVGAWSVRAAMAGASAVTAVDSSERALEGVLENAARNGVGDRISVRRGDAFAVLKQLKQEGQTFDVIVLDPPAFIKRRKDEKEGTLAYRRINEAALALLATDGILITASCSFHLSAESLLRVVQQAGRATGHSLQLLEQGHQGPDHPVHPAIVETAYLKAFDRRALPAF